jgi:hypothetical protein
MELLAFLLRQEPADREVELLSEIVRKLDGHPLYHVFQVALDGAQPGERQSLEDRAIKRFYALVGAEPDRGQWDRDRQVYCELRAEYSDDAILRAAEWTAANIRGAQTFVLVRATIAEALAQP